MPDLACFLPLWIGRTAENWQSEFLQLLTFVVATAYLIHKGSHESKDGQQKVEGLLVELNHQVKELCAAIAAVRADVEVLRRTAAMQGGWTVWGPSRGPYIVGEEGQGAQG